MENQKYIIRGDRSGVFFGEIAAEDGLRIKIANCRRLWYWEGAASLSQLALEGVKKPGKCKFTVTVPELIILDCIEIIPCTAEAVESINGVAVWRC